MATIHTNKHINIVVHSLPKKLKIYLWIKEFVAQVAFYPQLCPNLNCYLFEPLYLKVLRYV